MPNKGVKPKQGQIFAKTMLYARQLELSRLRLLIQSIERLIVEKKALRVSKKKKRE